MTMTDRGDHVEKGACAVDLAAAEWLQRRHFWTWTSEDQAELDAWLGESDAHRVAYLRQCAVWQSAERLIVLREPQPKQSETVKSQRPFLIGTAAMLVVAAILGGAAFFVRDMGITYATEIGGHKTITLADGSRIELNTDSVVRVNEGDDGRHAVLVRGEAYFEIHHDAAHPFSVTANTYRVTDLGTKFVMRNIANHLEVALVEGSARVQSTNFLAPVPSALLTPGDVVIADASSMSMTRKSVEQISDDLGWRHQVLVFKDATLEGAAGEFNRYNAEKLVVASPDIGSLKINGTFQAKNIELFAQSAKELFGLRVAKIGNETVISR